MVFEDISNYRKSEAWKYFWLDRSKEQAKCMKCLEEKNITKIFKVNNGNTKTLLEILHFTMLLQNFVTFNLH